jgi:hypothetical protein
MNRIISLLAGILLLASSGGCCCQHLCGRGTGMWAPMMSPACPPGGPCGVTTPGVAPLVQPQGFYGSYNVETVAPVAVQTVAPVAVAPVVTRTALVPLETLPTY